MPIRTVQEAIAEIGHHFSAVGEIMDAAHAEFLKECRGIAHKIHSRSKASIYSDLISRNLREYCDATDGAHYYRKGQLRLAGLENNWLAKVKRLKAGFAVGVSPTKASEDFNCNELPSYAADLFPHAPAATMLYAGWMIPENAPGTINKYFVCNDGGGNLLWTISLGSGTAPPSVQEPLPIDQGSDRVRVKVDASRKINE